MTIDNVSSSFTLLDYYVNWWFRGFWPRGYQRHKRGMSTQEDCLIVKLWEKFYPVVNQALCYLHLSSYHTSNH